MSNENNVVNLNRIKNLTRDDVIDQLERCQMAVEVTLPVANMEALLTQLLGYMDNSKPELQQKLTESERYGRQADITIENLERRVEQLAAENSGLRHLLDKISETGNANFGRTSLQTPATDAILAEVRASGVADEATERELFEVWVMQEICISKSTLEGLRTDAGYRNSTLSGTNYNRMWSQWKSIRAAKIRQEAK